MIFKQFQIPCACSYQIEICILIVDFCVKTVTEAMHSIQLIYQMRSRQGLDIHIDEICDVRKSFLAVLTLEVS